MPDQSKPSKLLLVGEAPGYQEIKDQQAFSARYDGQVNAGYVLWESAKQLGFDRDEVAVTNVVLCQTPGNRDPSAEEVSNCRPRLEATIKEIDPKMILSMGKVPFKGLTGKTASVASTRNRDWHLAIGGEKRLLWATYHPAGTLYNQSIFPSFTADLERAYKYACGDGTVDKPKAKFVVLSKPESLVALNSKLGDSIIVDLETTGLERIGTKILCAVVQDEDPDDTRVYVIPDEVLYDPSVYPDGFNEILKGRKQTGHNYGMFDAPILRDNGFLDAEADDDTMLLHFATDERKGTHGLKGLAAELCNAPDYDAELRSYLPTKDSSYSVVPRPVLYKYGAKDVWYTKQIKPKLEKTAHEDGVWNVYRNIMMPAIKPLAAMEHHGCLVNVPYVKDLEIKYERDMDEGLKEIEDKYGGLNPNSPQQVKQKMIDLELVAPNYEGGTDKEVLENLQAVRPDCDLMELVLRHRGFQKNLGTYIRGVLKRIWDDGRVRSNYLIHGTVTGRLASRDPNMHNIPRSKEMRDMFWAPPGKVLVNIDYSQFEFRMMGFYADDPVLREIYGAGGSIHREMATTVYGPDYTEEQYAWAKMINFGLLYGREAYSLSLQLKCSISDAEDFIEAFFERIPATRAYRDRIIAHVLEHGELQTVVGRKRRFPLITPANVKSVIKETLNFMPSSTCSDVVLTDMARMFDIRWIEAHAPMVNTLHDSVLFESDEDDVPRLAEIAVPMMREIPNELIKDPFPFDVEVKVGRSWGTSEEYPIPAMSTN